MNFCQNEPRLPAAFSFARLDFSSQDSYSSIEGTLDCDAGLVRCLGRTYHFGESPMVKPRTENSNRIRCQNGVFNYAISASNSR